MAQPPFLVDVLQIEPGSGETLTVSMDLATGEMKFSDGTTPSALLSSLRGIRNITGVFVVGRGGDAPYTSIQDALDDVPLASSRIAPSLIWVLPGLYTESIRIQKDGVILASAGGARLVNSGADDTVEVSASLESTPLWLRILGMELENTQTGYSCVNFKGADSFAVGDITVVAVPLVAGDTFTINGVTFTGVSGTRTSGSDNFSVAGGTIAAVAAEISAAINDEDNSLATTVLATPLLGAVNLEAIEAGSDGSTISLAVSTTPVGNLTVSGAFMTGGGSNGTVVGSQGFYIGNSRLVGSGVGSFKITADTLNYITVQGGVWEGSSASSTVENCAVFKLHSVSDIGDLNLSYDDSLDRPSVLSSTYQVQNCDSVGDVTCNLSGAGELALRSCGDVGDLTVGGTEELDVSNCLIGNLSLSGTTTATLLSSSRGSAVTAAGTPTLEESTLVGTVDFVASVSEVVTFNVLQPDTSYRVLLESPSSAVSVAVTTKTTAGFTVTSSAPLTGTVGYLVAR